MYFLPANRPETMIERNITMSVTEKTTTTSTEVMTGEEETVTNMIGILEIRETHDHIIVEVVVTTNTIINVERV